MLQNPNECTKHIPVVMAKPSLPFLIRQWQLNRLIDSTFPYPSDQTAPQHHMSRVGKLSGLLALNCGLEKNEIRKIRFAGRWHDAGKAILYDTSILTSTGELSPLEREELKRHPIYSVYLLTHYLPEIALLVAEIVRHHHEGNGYPDGLSGDKIPLGSQIVATADTFDATFVIDGAFRAYNRGTVTDPLAILSNSQLYNQEIVQVFKKMLSNRNQRFYLSRIYRQTGLTLPRN